MCEKETLKKSLSIGAGGALIASMCCITPLVIVLFGLGSVSFALSFTKYKYIFIILGLLFVVLAVFMSVKKQGKNCSIDANKIIKKKAFVLVIIVTMVVFYFIMQYSILPYLGKIVY